METKPFASQPKYFSDQSGKIQFHLCSLIPILDCGNNEIVTQPDLELGGHGEHAFLRLDISHSNGQVASSSI